MIERQPDKAGVFNICHIRHMIYADNGISFCIMPDVTFYDCNNSISDIDERKSHRCGWLFFKICSVFFCILIRSCKLAL